MNDALDSMTKEEIISWLRSDYFMRNRLPKMSEYFARKWEAESKAIMEEHEKLSQELRGMDLAKRDELARQFNASTDLNEKLSIAEKISPYDQKLQAWGKKSDALRIRQAKVDCLYSSIDIERQKERTEKI